MLAPRFRQWLMAGLLCLYERAGQFAAGALSLSFLMGYALAFVGNESAILKDYIYWWISTSTTLGYGEITPSNNWGQSAAMIVVMIGLGVLPVVLARIIGVIFTMIDKKLHGLSAVTCKDHTIIFGYDPARTSEIIDEILSNNPQACIALVDDRLEKNPYPARKIEFVRAKLSSADAMQRSNAAEANGAIIDGLNDDEAFFCAYTFRKLNTRAKLVCRLQNREHADKITKDLPADDPALNQVILPVSVLLMAQELQDAESSEVFQQLFSNLKGATQYRLDIPDDLVGSVSYGTLFMHFKQAFDATLIALKCDKIDTNPSLDTPVSAGCALFYIANKRLMNINWNEIERLDKRAA